MSEPVVTEADRERAREAWEEARDLGVVEAVAAALAVERAKAREPFLRLIDEEAAEAQERGQFYAITVEIPMAVGTETIDRIFGAVADAAHDCQPEQRDWDVFVHGCGPAHQGVPLHFIRRAAEETA